MTRDELLAIFDNETAAARDLMSRKNQDYAEVDEVFGNLNVCELLNITSAEQGILIRMTDKLRRLISLTKREAAVKDESFDDTCRDLINYTILLMARRRSRTQSSVDLCERMQSLRHYLCRTCGKPISSIHPLKPPVYCTEHNPLEIAIREGRPKPPTAPAPEAPR